MTRGKAYAALAFGLILIAAGLFDLIDAFVTGRTKLPRSGGNILDIAPRAGSTEFGLAALYDVLAVAVGIGFLFAAVAWWVGQDRGKEGG
jgi:hypothetical protein